MDDCTRSRPAPPADGVRRDCPVPVTEGALLKEVTTFRTGGPCRGLLHCRTPREAAAAADFLRRRGRGFLLLGGGSNLVVSQAGYDGWVLRYATETPSIRRLGDTVAVSASTGLDDLALWAAEQGLSGLNFASGIPGTVGGAIAGNAGAYGRQVGDVLADADVLGEDGRSATWKPAAFAFAYRHSALRDTGAVVLAARFRLVPGSRKALLDERAEILAGRAAKHPDLSREPSAGSFFRNIEPTSAAGRRQAAGWFLEQAGAKGFRCGGARVFPGHANIVVNGGGATAEDVHRLAGRMADAVRRRFGLALVREVRFVGKVAEAPYDPRRPVW